MIHTGSGVEQRSPIYQLPLYGPYEHNCTVNIMGRMGLAVYRTPFSPEQFFMSTLVRSGHLFHFCTSLYCRQVLLWTFIQCPVPSSKYYAVHKPMEYSVHLSVFFTGPVLLYYIGPPPQALYCPVYTAAKISGFSAPAAGKQGHRQLLVCCIAENLRLFAEKIRHCIFRDALSWPAACLEPCSSLGQVKAAS
jgi:hypothetical protein